MFAIAIPMVPAAGRPGSALQKEKDKRNTKNKRTKTTDNENTDTLTAMAQFAATLGLPWRPDAGTIAYRVLPTNLETSINTRYFQKKLKIETKK